VLLRYVSVPGGNGKRVEKTKVRSLDVMSAIKRSTVVKAVFLVLAQARIIAKARVNSGPK